MNRRGFLALLPLPWLGKVLPANPRVPDSAWVELDAWVKTQPLKQVGSTTFVCRKPEGVMLLRENMRIDVYDSGTWWTRLWARLRPPEPEPPPARITKIDFENRTVTYE